MSSSISKQLLLTAYAYLFIKGQQGAQQGSNALQLKAKSDALQLKAKNDALHLKITTLAEEIGNGNLSCDELDAKGRELRQLVLQAVEADVEKSAAEQGPKQPVDKKDHTTQKKLGKDAKNEAARKIQAVARDWLARKANVQQQQQQQKGAEIWSTKDKIKIQELLNNKNSVPPVPHSSDDQKRIWRETLENFNLPISDSRELAKKFKDFEEFKAFISANLQQEHMVWSQFREWEEFKAEALKALEGGRSDVVKVWGGIDSLGELKEKISKEPEESPATKWLQEYIELKDFLKFLGREAPVAGSWKNIDELVGQYGEVTPTWVAFDGLVKRFRLRERLVQAFELEDKERKQALKDIRETFGPGSTSELRDYYDTIVACLEVGEGVTQAFESKKGQEREKALEEIRNKFDLENEQQLQLRNYYDNRVAQWKLAPWQRSQRTSQKKIDRDTIHALFDRTSKKTISVNAWVEGGFKTNKDLDVNFANFAIWDHRIVGIPAVSDSGDGAPEGIQKQFEEFCNDKNKYDGFLHSTGNDTILTIPCRGQTQRALEFLSRNNDEAKKLMKAMQAISTEAKKPAGSGQAGPYDGMMYTEQRHNFVHPKTVVSEARIPAFFESLKEQIKQTYVMHGEGGRKRYVMPFWYSNFSQLQ